MMQESMKGPFMLSKHMFIFHIVKKLFEAVRNDKANKNVYLNSPRDSACWLIFQVKSGPR